MKFIQKRAIAADTSVQARAIRLDSESARAVGFAAEDGALFSAGAPSPAGWELPAGESPLAAFRLSTAAGEARLVCCKSGKTYRKLPAESAFSLSAVQFAGIPAAVAVAAEKPCLVLSDGRISAVLDEDGFAERSDIPAFLCGVWHYERLWLALPGEGGQVVFSAPGDPSDFSEETGAGGSIGFPDRMGGIRALLPVGIYLYVLRARGLQRLDARGSARDFELRDLFACGEVLPCSGAAVAGKLFWAERGGVFSYGGSGEAEKVCPAFGERLLAGAAEVRGAAVGRRYALQAGEKLAFFSADGGGAHVAAEGVSGLTEAGMLCVAGEVCEADGLRVVDGLRVADKVSEGGVHFPCVWESEPYSEGGRCLLRAVRVRARGEFCLEVQSGEGLRRIGIAGGGERRFAVNLAGENFVFRLRGGGKVYSLSAEYEKLRGGVQ